MKRRKRLFRDDDLPWLEKELARVERLSSQLCRRLEHANVRSTGCHFYDRKVMALASSFNLWTGRVRRLLERERQQQIYFPSARQDEERAPQ